MISYSELDMMCIADLCIDLSKANELFIRPTRVRKYSQCYDAFIIFCGLLYDVLASQSNMFTICCMKSGPFFETIIRKRVWSATCRDIRFLDAPHNALQPGCVH